MAGAHPSNEGRKTAEGGSEGAVRVKVERQHIHGRAATPDLPANTAPSTMSKALEGILDLPQRIRQLPRHTSNRACMHIRRSQRSGPGSQPIDVNAATHANETQPS